MAEKAEFCLKQNDHNNAHKYYEWNAIEQNSKKIADISDKFYPNINLSAFFE